MRWQISTFLLLFLSLNCTVSAETRQGGDTISDAEVIVSLPYSDCGTTIGYGDDYDESCPYTGNSSPDVVYRFTPTADITVDVSLCNVGTFYDTKVFIYENEPTPGFPLGCNDDNCSGPDFPYPYVSRLYGMEFTAGNNYFIVVCGYNGDSGDYCLSVDPILPCDEQCPPGAVLEGEPECGNGYDDQYNSGCGGEPPVFSQLPVEEILCATSGTFLYQGDATRDTDWYQFDLTDLTAVTVSLYPEFPANIMLIAANSGNCYDYDILEFASGERCQHTLVQGSLPAGLYWVWVAPTEFWGVDCGTPYILNLNTVGLPPIDNLQIQCQEEQLLLYWSPITGATIYHIYAGSTPYGDFEWVDSTTEALWGTTNSREQQFFQVTYEME